MRFVIGLLKLGENLRSCTGGKMLLRNAPRECNAYSYFYRYLVDKWESFLDSKERPEIKRQLIEELVKILREQAKTICERAKTILSIIEEGYYRLGYDVLPFEAKLGERGLFGTSQMFGIIPFEVGLEFDPYLNAPIIPGSSIKGVVRSVWCILFGERGKRSEDLIFGSTRHAGICIFHDGYPTEPGENNCLLYPDVLTPHYVRERKDILEEHLVTPSPIVYLTVAPGTKFKFIVAVRKEGVSRDVYKELQDKLKEAFREMLKLGIGSKTSIGYGRFTFLEGST